MVVKMVKLSESEASMSCITTSPPPSSKQPIHTGRLSSDTGGNKTQIRGALGHPVNEVPDNLTALLSHHHETSAAPGEEGPCIASEVHQGKDCMVVNVVKPWISSRVPIKILSPRIGGEHPPSKSDSELLV